MSGNPLTNEQQYHVFLSTISINSRAYRDKEVNEVAEVIDAEWGKAAGTVPRVSRKWLNRISKRSPVFIYRDDPLGLLLVYILPAAVVGTEFASRGDGTKRDILSLSARIEEYLRSQTSAKVQIVARGKNKPATNMEMTDDDGVNWYRVWSEDQVEVGERFTWTVPALKRAVSVCSHRNPDRQAQISGSMISLLVSEAELDGIDPESAVLVPRYTIIGTNDDADGEFIVAAEIFDWSISEGGGLV